MKVAIHGAGLFLNNLTLRVPFRYGITTMTRVPHLVVRVRAEIDGKSQWGFAADNLPPKWFTKNPATDFKEELDDMLAVAQHAADRACELGDIENVFRFWKELKREQSHWGPTRGYPPLLSNFGVSLVERALIDAFCRATGQTLPQAIHQNTLGIQLGEIHPELEGTHPTEFLPAAPVRSVIVRHTVGLTDALTDAEARGHEAPADGMPHSLEEFIRVHGLTHFKIKLGGEVERDRERLRQLAELTAGSCRTVAFTLDGNENFRAVAPFRQLWEGLRADPVIARFLAGLIFVEQPFHRDIALSESTTAELLSWPERPPIIIDESDAEDHSLRVALAGGYVGTSHKNCKGVFHGVANACLIAHRRKSDPSKPWQISAEDLTNLGPIALLQDLAVLATLGITHAERNGHHYFAGLSQFPKRIQEQVFQAHPDLYESHPAGYPIVRIREGRLAIGSVLAAPFGVGFEPDLTEFIPRADWDFATL